MVHDICKQSGNRMRKSTGRLFSLFSFFFHPREMRTQCKTNRDDWRVIPYESPFPFYLPLQTARHETRDETAESSRKPEFGSRKRTSLFTTNQSLQLSPQTMKKASCSWESVKSCNGLFHFALGPAVYWNRNGASKKSLLSAWDVE